MDPAKCLEILGSRGSCSGSHGEGHGVHAGCANGHTEATPTPSQASAEAAAQETVHSGGGGQVMNLSTGSNETVDAARAASSVSSAGFPDAAVAPSVGSGDGPDGEREAGGVDEGLEGMSATGLVASFRRAQEERVGLYRKFNGGLKEALRSGDYSGYPALCCEVTAAFSVLSKAINAIEARLNANAETKTSAGIIRRVQGHEQELLTVTAAHHLESMREARALGMGPGMTAHVGTGDTGSSSPAQERLLKEGVGELLRRAEGEAAAVTELLEELRYEAEELS